jgi:AraC-like DNA-binding protein
MPRRAALSLPFKGKQERGPGARVDVSNTWQALGSDVSSEGYDRVVERRRAVALARHFRESEGLSIAQIAERLGRSPATVKAYFYDPTGEKARAVKARYQGVCRGCGAYTQPRNGKGDAYAYCKACHPGAIERRWTRERVLDAMRAWRDLHGRLPTSYDWSRTHARRRGGDALRRVNERSWPSASVVTSVCGSWSAARSAVDEAVSSSGETTTTRSRRLGTERISVPNPR